MISSINLRERVDHCCHRGFISGANIVKVQHALNSTRLHAPNNGLCLFSEEYGCFGWGEKVGETSELGTHKDCIQTGEGGNRLRDKVSIQLLISKLRTAHTEKIAGREMKTLNTFNKILFLLPVFSLKFLFLTL